MNWEIDPQVVDTELGHDEIALVHMQTKRIYTMNPVGLFIWNAIKDNKSAEQIASALTAEFSVTNEQAQTDLEHWLKDLKQHKLLRQRPKGEK